jgi:hypothetical protein
VKKFGPPNRIIAIVRACRVFTVKMAINATRLASQVRPLSCCGLSSWARSYALGSGAAAGFLLSSIAGSTVGYLEINFDPNAGLNVSLGAKITRE